jgi:hypothetical protein
MQVNKYLQHIIHREGKCETLQASLDSLEERKRREMDTYLSLVGRRLGLEPLMHPSQMLTSTTPSAREPPGTSTTPSTQGSPWP